jgi:sugar phosphate isomerase/epimerase
MPDQNPVSLSATPATIMVQRPYYDLLGTVTMMERLLCESAVDGFEVQNIAEWKKENPPQDDVTGDRYTAWKKSPKYTVEEVAVLLEGVPVLSIHGNRDVGIYLCSAEEKKEKKGKDLICESLLLAEKVGAGICVFHLWDTWKSHIDVPALHKYLDGVAVDYPGVKAAVENIPTHTKRTPYDLVKDFEWVTLDLRWAAMYDELEKFESVKDRIVNVHVRGRLHHGTWVLTQAPFGVYEALKTIKGWGYKGLLTVEPEGGLDKGRWEELVQAMKSVKNFEE